MTDWSKAGWNTSHIETSETHGWVAKSNNETTTKGKNMPIKNQYINIIKKQLTEAGINDGNIIIKPTPAENLTSSSHSIDIFVKNSDAEEILVGSVANAYLRGAIELNNPELVDNLLQKFGDLAAKKYSNPDNIKMPYLTTNQSLLYGNSDYQKIMDEYTPGGNQMQTKTREINEMQQIEVHGCRI